MNYTVYCRLAWPKRCIISVKCVTSTTLGDTQRMLGLLGAAPGVVSYFRRNTARCVSRNGPKSDRCHLGDESPNLSGIGLRCVSCNRPQTIGITFSLVRISSLLTWSFKLIPCIQRSILISVLFSRCSSFFLIAQHSAAYSMVDLITV